MSIETFVLLICLQLTRIAAQGHLAQPRTREELSGIVGLDNPLRSKYLPEFVCRAGDTLKPEAVLIAGSDLRLNFSFVEHRPGGTCALYLSYDYTKTNSTFFKIANISSCTEDSFLFSIPDWLPSTPAAVLRWEYVDDANDTFSANCVDVRIDGVDGGALPKNLTNIGGQPNLGDDAIHGRMLERHTRDSDHRLDMAPLTEQSFEQHDYDYWTEASLDQHDGEYRADHDDNMHDERSFNSAPAIGIAVITGVVIACVLLILAWRRWKRWKSGLDGSHTIQRPMVEVTSPSRPSAPPMSPGTPWGLPRPMFEPQLPQPSAPPLSPKAGHKQRLSEVKIPIRALSHELLLSPSDNELESSATPDEESN